MKLTRLGHAALLIEASKTIIIDPFLTDNPLASCQPVDLPKIDLVLVTHDHFDHFGDTIAIAKRDSATFVGLHELTVRKDVTEAAVKTVGMSLGGSFDFEGITIALTPAVHGGACSGVVITIDGKRIYHAGDTALFSDMQLIPELFGELDVACLPIGGHFTMDAAAAARAAKLLRPKFVIPIHYNTWPPITADTAAFSQLVTERYANDKVKILEPGQSCEL